MAGTLAFLLWQARLSPSLYSMDRPSLNGLPFLVWQARLSYVCEELLRLRGQLKEREGAVARGAEEIEAVRAAHRLHLTQRAEIERQLADDAGASRTNLANLTGRPSQRNRPN